MANLPKYKMRIWILKFYSIFIAMNIFAQNPADNWFFGVGAGVNYFGGTPS